MTSISKWPEAILTVGEEEESIRVDRSLVDVLLHFALAVAARNEDPAVRKRHHLTSGSRRWGRTCDTEVKCEEMKGFFETMFRSQRTDRVDFAPRAVLQVEEVDVVVVLVVQTVVVVATKDDELLLQEDHPVPASGRGPLWGTAIDSPLETRVTRVETKDAVT